MIFRLGVGGTRDILGIGFSKLTRLRVLDLTARLVLFELKLPFTYPLFLVIASAFVNDDVVTALPLQLEALHLSECRRITDASLTRTINTNLPLSIRA